MAALLDVYVHVVRERFDKGFAQFNSVTSHNAIIHTHTRRAGQKTSAYYAILHGKLLILMVCSTDSRDSTSVYVKKNV